MAASFGRNARVTLTATRLLTFEKSQRSFSTCQICCGNTWHVHSKPTALKEIYNSPIDVKKFPGKGDVKEIKIPDKIERSPTAILEALASTVKNNLNQPMYKSIDDPYLYLTSDRQKKQLLAAMDSGNKSAQMMISMYPDYFSQIWQDPFPSSYKDPYSGYTFIDPSEEALLERIEKLAVQDAINVYKELMANKNIPSQDTQEKLLELLAVFNCQNQEPVSDLSNYVNLAPLSKNAPFPASTWKKKNMAEQVFHSLPDKTAKAYCYLIRGMAANFDKHGSMELFKEMKAANLSADVYTYNLLLTQASIEAQNMDEVIEYIEVLLRDMTSSNVRPNVETFNSILINCRRLSRWTGSKNYALSVLSEMKACGIEPSLATYEEIIRIFYYRKDTGQKTPNLFEKILDEIEGKEFGCKSEGDATFFRTAIKAIVNHFPDSKYALRLHKIFQSGKNSDFLGHRQVQYSYYNDFFTLITPLEHIDVVMEFYSEVVPFIFAPPSEMYHSLIDSIQMYDAYGHIPRLYADIQFTTMFHDAGFIEKFSKLLSLQKHDSQLQGQLCDIAIALVNKWLESRGALIHNKPYLDGSVIGHLMMTFLNNDDSAKAWSLFQLYQDNADLHFESPSEASLTRLTDHLIEGKDYASAKKVLNLMQYLQYSGLSPLVEKALTSFELSDQERNYLKGLAADSLSSPGLK